MMRARSACASLRKAAKEQSDIIHCHALAPQSAQDSPVYFRSIACGNTMAARSTMDHSRSPRVCGWPNKGGGYCKWDIDKCAHHTERVRTAWERPRMEGEDRRCKVPGCNELPPCRYHTENPKLRYSEAQWVAWAYPEAREMPGVYDFTKYCCNMKQATE